MERKLRYVTQDSRAGAYPDEPSWETGADKVPPDEDALLIVGYGQFALGALPHMLVRGKASPGGGDLPIVFTRQMGETVLALEDEASRMTEVYPLQRGVDPWTAPSMTVADVEEFMAADNDRTNPNRTGEMHVMWPGNQENLSGKELEIWQLNKALRANSDTQQRKAIEERLRKLGV